MTREEINETVEAAVDRAFSNLLLKFGLDEDEHKELRLDFVHLRKWRRSVEQMQIYTFRTVITVVVTGFVGAVWLGIRQLMGK